MSTIYIGIAGLIVLIIILDKIPGLKHLIHPIIAGITWVIGTFFGSTVMWLIWATKVIIRSHITYLVHLTKKRGQIDPTDGIK